MKMYTSNVLPASLFRFLNTPLVVGNVEGPMAQLTQFGLGYRQPPYDKTFSCDKTLFKVNYLRFNVNTVAAPKIQVGGV